MKKLISMLLILMLCLMTANVFAADASQKDYPQRFWDVPKDHWAFTYIAELVNKGVLAGYEDGSFRPDNTVTRAEWAKIMVLAAGLPANDNNVYYTDMSNHWANIYVNTAKDYLAAYTDGTFRPDQAAVREDVTVSMVKLKGYDVSNVDYSYLSQFTDTNSISNSLKAYVAVAVEKDLISGFDDGTFRGQDTLTRAEAATLLWRAFQYGNDNKVVDAPAETSAPSASAPIQTPTPTDQPIESPKPTPDLSEEPAETIKPTETPEPTPEPSEVPKKHNVTTVAYTSEAESLVINSKDEMYYLSGGQIKKIADGQETDVTPDISFTKPENEIAAEMFGNIDTNDLTGRERGVLEIDRPIEFLNPVFSHLTYDPASDAIYAFASLENEGKSIYDTYRCFGIWEVVSGTPVVVKYSASWSDHAEYLSNYEPISAYTLGANRNLYYMAEVYPNYDYYVSTVNTATNRLSVYTEADPGRGGREGAIGMIDNSIAFFTSEILYRYNIGQDTFDKIYLTTELNTDIACPYNNHFYTFSDGSAYTVDGQGQVEILADSAEIDYLDGAPIRNVGTMAVNSQGNIVFYDSAQGAIRLLTINAQ